MKYCKRNAVKKCCKVLKSKGKECKVQEKIKINVTETSVRSIRLGIRLQIVLKAIYTCTNLVVILMHLLTMSHTNMVNKLLLGNCFITTFHVFLEYTPLNIVITA